MKILIDGTSWDYDKETSHSSQEFSELLLEVQEDKVILFLNDEEMFTTKFSELRKAVNALDVEYNETF